MSERKAENSAVTLARSGRGRRCRRDRPACRSGRRQGGACRRGAGGGLARAAAARSDVRRDARTARTVCTSSATCRRPSGRTAWSRSSRSPTRSKRTSTWCSRRRRRRSSARPARTRQWKTSSERPQRSWNGPEPLIDGVVDLGALATEFLILGLDPYPRKPGAVFELPQDVKPDPGPFAALAGLQGRQWPLTAVVSGRRTVILPAGVAPSHRT